MSVMRKVSMGILGSEAVLIHYGYRPHFADSTGRSNQMLAVEVLYKGQHKAALSIDIAMNVEHEVELLKQEIKRLGTPDETGNIQVTFGTLFHDDRCANIFEALVGTLKAGKRKKIIHYDGELLLQGVHDNVMITLLKDA